MYKTVVISTDIKVPSTQVKRGDLIFNVVSKGELHGGNSEMLTAPLTGGGEMHVTYLPKPGDLVKAGDVVVEFDPTDQEYKLKEAESDVSETKLKVEQAQAQAEADSEEAKYALLQAESDVRSAELDVRKNPILPAISARQNDLALAAAQDRMNQLRKDLENKGATNQAAIAVQQAALGKAEIQAATAKRNIESLTLKAKNGGYVSIRPNQSGNFQWGMTLPEFQIGDTVHGGVAIAEIPDLHNWEVPRQHGRTRSRSHPSWADGIDRCRRVAGQEIRGQGYRSRWHGWPSLEPSLRVQDPPRQPIAGAAAGNERERRGDYRHHQAGSMDSRAIAL
jgi:hypothetical protein